MSLDPSSVHLSPSQVITRHRVSPWTAVPMEQAFQLIETNMPQGTCKFIPTVLARPDQVLVSRVVSRYDVPEYHTSIKDGYAVIASDGSSTRRVIGTRVAEALSGDDNGSEESCRPLQLGECMRVCTGSVMPAGADAVVMVEKTTLIEHDGKEEQVIGVNESVRVGQDVRQPGSDIREGECLVESGTILGSAEIGLLASTARRDIEVYRRPRVCVMSTGNEIVDCSNEDVLQPGQVRDSNRPQLISLLQQKGFKAIDAGIVPDNRESLVEGIRVAFKFANVLISTGGVSMGEKDLMKDVLQNEFNFTIHFGRVLMKPGLPATFATGTFEDIQCAVFALPGNPVSSWVCTELFAVPALRRMAGYTHPYQSVLQVKLGSSLKLDARPEYVRAVLAPPNSSITTYDLKEQRSTAYELLPIAYTTGSQASSRLLSLTGANLLLRLPKRSPELQVLPEGTVVDALVVGSI